MIQLKLKLKPKTLARYLFHHLLFFIYPHLVHPFPPLMTTIQRYICVSPSTALSSFIDDSNTSFGMDVLQGNGSSSSRQFNLLSYDTLRARSITRRMAATGIISTFFVGISPVAAFDNGVPEMAEYKSRTKYPGIKPTTLGLQGNGKLAKCTDAPNCFSTSGDDNHLLKLWKSPKGSNAMDELLETIKSYPPGQARIDRGGFSIITSRPDYLYVQFESLKNGFIDDVEFAVNAAKGEVQVRSSSRIGFLDLGVNGKRLNWISSQLRVKKWIAPAITQEDYPDYFPMMPFSYDDYVRSVLSPEDCPVPSVPLECKDPSPR